MQNILLILSSIFVVIILFSIKNHKKTNEYLCKITKNQFVIDSIWFFGVVILLSAVVFILFSLNYVFPSNKENGFFSINGDIFVILVSIISLVAAIWTVWAKIESTNAYNEAKKLKEAIGSPFKFDSIMSDQNKLNFIINEIGKPNSIVSLYLGFPVVGWFSKGFDRDQSIQFILQLHQILITKVLIPFQADPNLKLKYKLNIGIFDDSTIKRILEKIGTDQTTAEHDKNTIKAFIELIDLIEQKISQYSTLKENILIYKDIPIYKEKFRFASVRNTTEDINKGLLWIIPDFRKQGDEIDISFESACFQTGDSEIINILNEVFKDVKDSGATETQLDQKTIIDGPGAT